MITVTMTNPNLIWKNRLSNNNRTIPSWKRSSSKRKLTMMIKARKDLTMNSMMMRKNQKPKNRTNSAKCTSSLRNSKSSSKSSKKNLSRPLPSQTVPNSSLLFKNRSGKCLTRTVITGRLFRTSSEIATSRNT